MEQQFERYVVLERIFRHFEHPASLRRFLRRSVPLDTDEIAWEPRALAPVVEEVIDRLERERLIDEQLADSLEARFPRLGDLIGRLRKAIA